MIVPEWFFVAQCVQYVVHLPLQGPRRAVNTVPCGKYLQKPDTFPPTLLHTVTY